MKITNYGTPFDAFFKDVECGSSFIFHGMVFMKVEAVKQYKKDLDLPDNVELPGGKDYIIRNAVQLEDGSLWNFSDSDTVETPLIEVAIGVKAPMPAEAAADIVENRAGIKGLQEAKMQESQDLIEKLQLQKGE